MPICFVRWKNADGKERNGAVVGWEHRELFLNGESEFQLWAVVMCEKKFFFVRGNVLEFVRWGSN